MRILLACHDGLSDALRAELERYSFLPEEYGRTYIITRSEPENAAKLLLKVQTATRALKIITSFSFKDYEDFREKLKDAVREEQIKLLPSNHVVRCSRHGTHDFRSPDIAKAASEHLRSFPPEKADRSSEEKFLHTVLFYVEDNTAFMGVDLTGNDMSKRDYRIFRNNSSFKGTVAASMLYLSGLKENYRIVDAFCKDGTVSIEAAFLSGKAVLRKFSWENTALTRMEEFKGINFRDISNEESDRLNLKLYASDKSSHNIVSAKKNAQIAGLKGKIDFFREDISWLSTRFGDKSVDAMTSFIPSPSSSFPPAKVEKLYRQYLENAVIILKDGGTISAVMTAPDLFLRTAEKFGFKQHLTKRFMMGRQEAFIIILEK